MAKQIDRGRKKRFRVGFVTGTLVAAAMCLVLFWELENVDSPLVLIAAGPVLVSGAIALFVDFLQRLGEVESGYAAGYLWATIAAAILYVMAFVVLIIDLSLGGGTNVGWVLTIV